MALASLMKLLSCLFKDSGASKPVVGAFVVVVPPCSWNQVNNSNQEVPFSPLVVVLHSAVARNFRTSHCRLFEWRFGLVVRSSCRWTVVPSVWWGAMCCAGNVVEGLLVPCVCFLFSSSCFSMSVQKGRSRLVRVRYLTQGFLYFELSGTTERKCTVFRCEHAR